MLITQEANKHHNPINKTILPMYSSDSDTSPIKPFLSLLKKVSMIFEENSSFSSNSIKNCLLLFQITFFP